MYDEIKSAIDKSAHKIFNKKANHQLTTADEKFGDLSSNISFKLASIIKMSPFEISKKLCDELGKTDISPVKEVKTEGAYLNFILKDRVLYDLAKAKTSQVFKNKKIVIEYSDPNPFKILHIGHLYTSVVGDSISKLFEMHGAEVHRVNFGGDVGMHVAKSMWAIINELGGEKPQDLKTIDIEERPQWLSRAYIRGNHAFENDAKARDEITDINRKIYEIHNRGDNKSALSKIYWTCRQWSYDHFQEFYKKIGSEFERFYPESATIEKGLVKVKENIGKVFEKSDGAIIYRGEKQGLHTRVFINKEGLPTYETKDIGLAFIKWEDYKFDKSIIITGNEQKEYMEVVYSALSQLSPELAEKTQHVTHGMVKLSGQEKMSSRKGNVVEANELIRTVKRHAETLSNESADMEVVLSAIKYGLLKHKLGTSIIYDPAESLALEGNSGPYLLYAYVRAKSIINKSKIGPELLEEDLHLEKGERALIRRITLFQDVCVNALNDLAPHQVCTYLYELAQAFNKFYESNRVIGHKREAIRISIIKLYSDTIKQGLGILNIKTVEKM